MRSADGKHVVITAAELQWILTGVDLSSIKKRKRYTVPSATASKYVFCFQKKTFFFLRTLCNCYCAILQGAYKIAGGRIIRRRFESIESKSVATKRTLPVFKPPSGELAVSCARRNRVLGTYLATPKSTLFSERRCTLSHGLPSCWKSFTNRKR